MPVPLLRRGLAALRISLALLCSAFSADALTAAGTAFSDRLVVIDHLGASQFVQHTLHTHQSLLALTLPDDLVTQHLRIISPYAPGSGADTQTVGHVAISSGSVFLRYRQDLTREARSDNSYRLRMRSVPAGLHTDLQGLDAHNFESVQTWVFPSNVELLGWSSEDTGTSRGSGEWSVLGNTLSWRQRGLEAISLSIDYYSEPQHAQRRLANTQRTAEPTPSDDDQDGVPDHRDVCLSVSVQTNEDTRTESSFGCSGNTPLILDEVRFQSGRTALNLTARRQLNRLAEALVTSSHTRWEIAGFTDNAGAATKNRDLSARRAEAVRHYLILRGVPAEHLSAKGYGEEFPITDNASAEHRAANRRIELRRWIVTDNAQ